jgi:undecaprenyl diphosphate synthase
VRSPGTSAPGPGNAVDTRLPRHIGIIMDGNGRWARERGRSRSEGHREGLEAARRVVAAAVERRISYLTMFTFSTENWTRASEEVSYLMFLIRSHIRKEFDFYRANGVRLLHAGDIASLPRDVAGEIRDAVADTAGFTRMTLVLAINYGGRSEIVRAVRRAAAAGVAAELTEEGLRPWLDQPSVPDPDLIIRTAGERRLSNFLLWQGAYAELYTSARLWPDWGADDLDAALADYAARVRRFGGDGAADAAEAARPGEAAAR